MAVSALDLKDEPTQLGVILQQVLELLDPVKRSRITANVERDLVGNWDPNVIRRVLTNLISNALKYSDGDGPIEITVAPSEDRLCSAWLIEASGFCPRRCRFSSSGTGEPMADENEESQGPGWASTQPVASSRRMAGESGSKSPGRDQGTIAFIELPLMTDPPESEIDL